MRLIGHLDNEATARTFGDYLLVQGIENQLEPDSGHGWAIWIADEDRIQQAMSILDAYRTNPSDPLYQEQARAAHDLRAEKQKEEAAYQQKLRGRRNLFRPLTGYRFGPLTFVLIALSVLVALRSKFGDDPEAVLSLFIVDPTLHLPHSLSTLWAQLRTGEVWRLVTPVFIHFGMLHILFNMLWLADLGSMIEGRQSTWFLGVLVLATAAFSNIAQYLLAGPVFGGMSGVVYGLLGYIWIRGKYDPGSGLFLHSSTITMMIIWFVAGWTGLLGGIANWAHAGGLLLGMAWGYFSSLRYH